MFISKNIPIDVELVLSEICKRQGEPWNNGMINDHSDYPNINMLFSIINSGIPEEDFFYKGDLFRIHTPYTGLVCKIDPQKEFCVDKPCSDGSGRILRYTTYSVEPVAFSKSHNFTDQSVFDKVCANEKAVIIHVNTKSQYGIDVNKLQKRFGIQTRYEKEQEVLFPLLKEFVIKEYITTPNKAKYYLRRFD